MTLRHGARIAVVGASLMLLAACGRSPGQHGAADVTAPSASVVPTSASPSASAQPTGLSVAPSVPASAQQSSALAAVASDLNGIDAGTNQANADVNAGDTARNQNDAG